MDRKTQIQVPGIGGSVCYFMWYTQDRPLWLGDF